jgi:septation ring formation regulator EzrA
MSGTGTALKDQISSMMSELDALKTNFGEVDKTYSTLQKSKVEIDAIRKKIAKIREEAASAADELKAISTMKGSTEAKGRATQKAAAKVRTVNEAAKDVDSDLLKLSKEAGAEESAG